ncbi:MAG: TonB-dependent receptor [Hyphomonas sp.]
MAFNRDSKSIWLAGASALAMSLFAPAAIAQEAPAAEEADNQRTLTKVTVTTQKVEESIQDVPIAVSAFDESAIERLQLTGGSDLVKAVPNVSFTKGNFTGDNFKVRGIGNDAVGNSSDAGVGVHQNDVPLQDNLLFEAEYFDMERVEVLRGPQGTLYGRNATGGVVNVITAKPKFGTKEADIALTYGNHNTLKAKGMFNVPIGDKMALRVAGSTTTRDGYVNNTATGNDIDDRSLWGMRATLGFEPTETFRGWLSYEHFEEDDSRLRTGKQLCSKDPFKSSFGGVAISPQDQLYTSLGCTEAPLSDSYDRVNTAASLAGGYAILAGLANGDLATSPLDPNLRNISSAFDPRYAAEQDLWTLKLEMDLGENLTLTSLTSSNEVTKSSEEDYNKFVPDTPFNTTGAPFGNPALAAVYGQLFPGGVVTDPQLGASNQLRVFDISASDSEAITQEIRLQSDFDGRFNFNLGAIYMDYEIANLENTNNSYYVLSNGLTAVTQINNHSALGGAILGGLSPVDDANPGDGSDLAGALDGTGRNYFRSVSPYQLESKALFGEGYFDATEDLTVTVGLRYTDDQKSQQVVPSLLFTPVTVIPEDQAGVPQDVLEADFQEVTGRIGADWTPDLDFTDDSLFFASYAKGYKGGGINPPQPAGANLFPQLFDPEFVNAWEVGTKNTFADGTQQLNLTGFMYDYEGYQITQIINRSSVNFNVDAEINGFELEYLWTPANNWLLTANVGFLDAKVKDTFGIDVLDRTNGRSDLVALKNAENYSNCVVSAAGYQTILGMIAAGTDPVANPLGLGAGDTGGLCLGSFTGAGAAFGLPQVSYVDADGNTQTVDALTPFEGEAANLDGNKMPGAPDMTLNLAAEYTFQNISDSSWDLTIRGDYYMQAESESRVWNSGRDELESWSNVNLSILLNNYESGWGIEAYAKNLTDEEVITGTYLTDDSSGLFTNIFLTEPALYGLTVKKSW